MRIPTFHFLQLLTRADLRFLCHLTVVSTFSNKVILISNVPRLMSVFECSELLSGRHQHVRLESSRVQPVQLANALATLKVAVS
jgi:hypothetical protein